MGYIVIGTAIGMLAAAVAALAGVGFAGAMLVWMVSGTLSAFLLAVTIVLIDSVKKHAGGVGVIPAE